MNLEFFGTFDEKCLKFVLTFSVSIQIGRACQQTLFCDCKSETSALKMTDLDETPSPEFNSLVRQNVITPEGTPGPPGAASTVARPPPKPRRLPNINIVNHDDFDGLISIGNGGQVVFSRHQDTPYSSPGLPDQRSSLGIMHPEDMKTDFSALMPNQLDESYKPTKEIGTFQSEKVL